MSKDIVKNGLLAADFMNIGGVLLFSRAFTNQAINNAEPMIMSNFGLVMIVVWGLAYWGAAAIDSNIKWLAGAFAVEKLVYVVAWAMWLSKNSLGQLYAVDAFAGVFFGIYGLNDLVFMLFFLLDIFVAAGAQTGSAAQVRLVFTPPARTFLRRRCANFRQSFPATYLQQLVLRFNPGVHAHFCGDLRVHAGQLVAHAVGFGAGQFVDLHAFAF